MKSSLYPLFPLLILLINLFPSHVSSSDLPTHFYTHVKTEYDDDGTQHIFAEYRGNSFSVGDSLIIRHIEMVISFHSTNTFRVKVLDQNSKRWEIPEQDPFPHFESDNRIEPTESCCEVHVENEPFFGVYITRKDTNEILFDTRNREMVYSDLFIQLSTAVPSNNIYGFGERAYKFKLSPGIYTIWGRDDQEIVETGQGGGNTYSHHPVGLVRDKTGNFFLSLMRNSNAMDVIVENNNVPGITYKMVGGIIDLIFFVGDDYPETILKAYHGYLGNFTMMPFWAMGYQQSRWGYASHDIMKNVVENFTANNIPLDVIWSDIDYMVEKEIFTMNTEAYPPQQMRELTTVHKKKWVPIIDPGVRQENPRGPGAKEGLDRDIFIKNHKGEPLVGNVWPGNVYFPDFWNPKAEKYWGDMLEVLYQTVPFAGLWLDMNEIASFVDGEVNRDEQTKYDKIPYNPGSYPLRRKTISLDAVHHGGIIEYDTHSLFSILENAATHKFLKTKSELPFILSRSTSVGMGKFSAHWTGDNAAHWNFLQLSIPGNFNFQIFGIPFVGADICGFMYETNEELCARWTQVGALYPFARNHHEMWSKNQEPWIFEGNNAGITVTETARASIKTRYAILKWYYSLFVETQGQGSVFRPMMFEFPHDDELYNDGFGDWEFLLGKSVLCTPKVEPGEPYVEAYFPKTTWYELFTGKRYMDKEDVTRVKRVETPFNASVPMFLRSGHIVHRQNVDNVLSTEDLNNQFELIAALERENEAGLLKAKGTIMGIERYDDESVYHRCMDDNCLYEIAVVVTEEDVTSAAVEIRFKAQKPDTKVPLDTLELYSLRLYGLPLDYMVGDEDKVGYGLVMVEEEDGSSGAIVLLDLIAVEEDAFEIVFKSPVKIGDGSVIRLDLMI